MFDQMIQTLELRYQVNFESDHRGTTCRIITDSTAKTHTILIDNNTSKDSDRAEYLVAHELCHARLAERLDVAFASLMLGDNYSPEVIGAFYLAWILPTDWWVNQLRHKFFPSLTTREIYADLGDFERLGKPEMVAKMMTDTPICTLAFALGWGESIMYKLNLNSRFARVISSYPARTELKTVRDWLVGIEPLSDDSTIALQQLQAAIVESAKIQKLQYVPKRNEKGLWCL